jgi:hypothetical protein
MSERTDTLMEAISGGTGTRRASSREGSNRFFLLVLFALFVVALLIAIATGTGIYRSLSTMQANADDNRLGLSLIANSVKATDATDAVAVGNGPEGRSLVLVERLTSGTYETRLYLYQGYLVEEYALASSAYTPAKASRIVASSTFNFNYRDGLLSVTTDQGTIDVALRNVQGGV